MNKKEMVQQVEENLENFKPVLGQVVQSVDLHKVSKSGSVDGVIWRGPIILKEGGEALLEVFGDLAEGQEKEKLSQALDYWNNNYQIINKDFFDGEGE
ncbi:MAG: hypothetical protein QF632_04320 [Candidatus Woesearchaeota archaeon]|jgi:hypothetical protein|nr:hypothetical protein [Candidatus Woesearchaeota archaeon]